MKSRAGQRQREEKRKIRREKSRRERVRRKKMQMRGKVRKSWNTAFFQWFVAPEGRKVGSLKRRGAEPAGQMRDEKLHAVAARSTSRSENVQTTTCSRHFWKLRCRKSARRCGAKHISKSKCTKHLSLGPLLEVEMSKKCTPLWREAGFEVKMYKTPQPRTTFGSWDVGKVHAIVARSTFPSQNVQNTSVSHCFWKLRCRKSARRCGAKHISEVKMYKAHQLRTTFGSWDVEKVYAVVARSTFRSQNVKNTRVSDHFWRFRCRFASLDYITLHSTTLHSATLHYITQQYNYNYTTTLHYTPLHSATLHYTKSHYTTLHYTTLHSTSIILHYTTLHYTTLHYTTFHYTSLHYTTLHSTTLQLQLHNYTPLQYTPLH